MKPTRLKFKGDMLGVRAKHHQILRGVVLYVAVNVVDTLTFSERPAEFLLGFNPMNCLAPLLQITHSMPGFESLPMLNTAKLSSTTEGVPRIKLTAAFKAFSHRFITPEGRITKLRTPSPLARLAACFTFIHSAKLTHNADKSNTLFSPHCLGQNQEELF